jgi:hypothetical protein
MVILKEHNELKELSDEFEDEKIFRIYEKRLLDKLKESAK